MLAEPTDRLALEVAAAWARRHGPLLLLSIGELLHAPLLTHRLGHGPAETACRLHDGRELAAFAPTAVLNRLTQLPESWRLGWAMADRSYAAAEIQALLLSVLAALPGRMANRPSTEWLAGPACTPLVWAALAAQAGLPVLDQGLSTRPRTFPPPPGAEIMPEGLWWAGHQAELAVHVVGGTVPDLPPALAALAPALARLAAQAGAALLKVELAQTAAGWAFLAADPAPRRLPPAVLQALLLWLAGAD